MNSVKTMLMRAGQVALMLAALGAAQETLAVGTPSGTSVNNRATVTYDVATVTQTPIESSPTGNSTPGLGAGTDTAFVVDNMVDLTLTEVSGTATPVNPGQASAVTAFDLENTGNTSQGYTFTISNLTAADGAVNALVDTGLDMNNLRAYIDGNGNGTYDVLTDTATAVSSLAPDTVVRIFVVVDVPIGAADADISNVRLRATTADDGTTTTTVETAGPDTAGVDVVFADANNDGYEESEDGYTVTSADILISKTSAVISDPINGSTDPKAIPGAEVEYTITLTNSGGEDATDVLVTDVISPDVTLLLGQYAGGDDVLVEVGTPAVPVTCTADANDGDGDGCALTGGTLEVSPLGLTIGSAAADNPVVVQFRATIN